MGPTCMLQAQQLLKHLGTAPLTSLPLKRKAVFSRAQRACLRAFNHLPLSAMHVYQLWGMCAG